MTHSYWAHGNSLVLQLRGRAKVAYRKQHFGWGVQSSYAGWVHLPIAAPVIVAGVRARLLRAMLVFDSWDGTALKRFGIWDGDRPAQSFDGLDLEGYMTKTFELPAPHELHQGLCLSMEFMPGRDSVSGAGWKIHAGGVDLDF